MLINFSFKNFRSFYDEMVFSMERTHIREQAEKIIKPNCECGNYELLPAKVVYGVNASGKSSLVLGVEFLQEIVRVGSISPEKSPMLKYLPVYHFLHEKKKFFSPMQLSISFINDEKLFDYMIEVTNIATEGNYDCKITKEKLKVNNIVVFNRNGNKVVFNPYNDKDFDKIVDVSYDYLKETEKNLDLNNYSIFTSWLNFDRGIIDSFSNYFLQKLDVISTLDNITMAPKISQNETITNLIKRLVKAADFGPQEIVFYSKQTEGDSDSLVLKSKYRIYDEDNPNNVFGIECPVYNIESLGTIKLLNFIVPLLKVILNGDTLIVDEFDSSIHPEVIAAIVKCFSDPEVNTKGAQLIFTTHNPVFLNDNLFRRDEIVFVEKNTDTFESEIFTLNDCARSDDSYLKRYLEEKYINFTNIDFARLLINIREEMENGNKEEN